jgi:hypothetical protein
MALFFNFAGINEIVQRVTERISEVVNALESNKIMHKTFTLRSFYESYPEIHETMWESIKPFCINLCFPNQHEALKTEFGSGVCACLNARSGILTNHHVADIFIKKQHGYVYTPHPQTHKLTSLKFKKIISLPENPNEINRGVDIAFIELETNTDIETIGKKLWDLDASTQKYLKNSARYWSAENTSYWSWGINATSGEGVRLIHEPVSSEKEVFYPKSGFHWVGCSRPVLFSSTYFNQSKKLIKFIYPLIDKAKMVLCFQNHMRAQVVLDCGKLNSLKPMKN